MHDPHAGGIRCAFAPHMSAGRHDMTVITSDGTDTTGRASVRNLHSILIGAMLATALGSGCGDADDGDDGAAETGDDAATGSDGADDGVGTDSGSGAVDDAPPPDPDSDSGDDTTGGARAELEVVEAFDPAMFQLPEGLAVQGDSAWVSFALLGQVWRIDLTGAEEPSLFAQVPPLPAEGAFITGLVHDDEDRLYIAHPSFLADPVPGIYRSEATGGNATLWATHEQMLFPSGMRWHGSGDMFVTDSATATVFRVTPEGVASVWISDALLAGDKTFCGNDEALFDIGANGIAVTDDAVYVAVSDQASILEIPIAEDGSAGSIAVVVGPDCEGLGGIDDMERGEDGTYWVALNHQNRIGRVDPDGTITVLTDDPALDFPATVRFG